MRQSDPPVLYLVGTPKGRLSQLEAQLAELSWQQAREGVAVKLLPQTGEVYLLRSNMPERAPAQLREFYLQRVQVEQAFKHFKGDLALRPFYHKKLARIEAHIFIAFLAYCLHVTLGRRLRDLAPGLTPRVVLEKLAAIQMIDVHLPTTDGREVVLTRYTQPDADQRLLLDKLKLQLPTQPPPKITTIQPPPSPAA